MKDLINLLPPTAVKDRTRRIYLLRWGIIQRRVLIILVLLVAVLIVSIVTLNSIKREVMRHNLNEGETASEVLVEMKDTNRRLTLISAWKRNNEPWTPLLEDVFAIVPPTVELTEISTDTKENSLELKGVISSRDSLLTFQKQLEALSWVEKLEAPLSNFQTGTDTEFQFIVFRTAANIPSVEENEEEI